MKSRTIRAAHIPQSSLGTVGKTPLAVVPGVGCPARGLNGGFYGAGMNKVSASDIPQLGRKDSSYCDCVAV